MQLMLPDETATLATAALMGNCLPTSLVIYLEGQLGAGKTTLVRGLIQSLGYAGRIKSPTYGLVERYELPDHLIHHLDLYRLGHPEELEFLGIRDLVEQEGVMAIEWPERGAGLLPAADVVCKLEVVGEGRQMGLEPFSDSGREWVESIARQLDSA
jgi:tRNA threonylcarbamoyladenosine biosynthesis protein TsaE